MHPPVGISSFGELIRARTSEGENFLYIDKTLLIKDLMNDSTKTILFTRPRRFGKTLTLSMIQHFFAPEVNGIPTQGLFDGLNISKVPGFIERYQGKIPVIFISFKDCKFATYQETRDWIAVLIKQLYRSFDYLLSSDHLSEFNKNDLMPYFSDNIEDKQIAMSLKFLSEMLYKHHGNTSVHILIDEYDAPIQSGIINGYYQEIVQLVRAMFGAALKDNDFLNKSVLTGVFQIARESLFSGLNHFESYNVLSERYSQYFGFTPDEVANICPKEHLADLKEWYNGYIFGSHVIYNPWSVLKFLKSNFVYKPYWSNTGSDSLLIANFHHEHIIGLQELMERKSVPQRIDETLTFEDLSDRATFWSLMLMTGYVTAKDVPYGEMHHIRFPNKEIHDLFKTLILRWYSGAKESSVFFSNFLESFIRGNKEDVTKGLQRIILHNLSFHDVGENAQESFYHGLMLGFFLGLQGRYEVKSNRESGYGRYDIALIPRNPSKDAGVILECKVGKEAALGILQIQEKGYVAELKAAGCSRIYLYGLAFNGKRVDVEMAEDIQASSK